jgi:hypothetical protein
LDGLSGQKPFFKSDTIPVGWAKGISAPVTALSLDTVVVISADIPEEVAYNITKAMFEHKKELEDVQPQWKIVTKETAIKDLPVKLHPGAEKYYKEKGFPISYLK